jgi:hypothetical protein
LNARMLRRVLRASRVFICLSFSMDGRTRAVHGPGGRRTCPMLRAREASRRRAIAPAHVITQSPRFSGGVESKRVRHWRLAHSVVELLAGDLEGEE